MIKTNKIHNKYRLVIYGFTLIEVLFTIGLALLILTLVYLSLYSGGKTSASMRAKTLRQQELMREFHEIRRQLTNLYKTHEGVCFLGEEGIEPRRSEIYFITSSLNNYQGVGEAGYKILRDDRDGSTYLGYTEFPYPRENRFAILNPQDKWNVSSTLIKGLEVEYEKSNQWFKEWKEEEPPQKIRITFWYESHETEGEMSSYTFIVVPGIKSLF